jgi:transcription antitermination factor NusG
VGDYVDVVAGPFKGMTGKVLDIDEWKPGLIRISVQVEIMGKKVPVDLSWKEIELV